MRARLYRPGSPRGDENRARATAPGARFTPVARPNGLRARGLGSAGLVSRPMGSLSPRLTRTSAGKARRRSRIRELRRGGATQPAGGISDRRESDSWNGTLGPDQRPVLDAVRLVGLGAEPRVALGLVVLEVALEARAPASRPRTPGCASRCGRGTSGRARSPRRSRRTSSSASSSARSVSTSRSLVGSSSSSRLPPLCSSFARCSAVALAAREVPDPLLLVGAAEVEPRAVGARVDLALAELDQVVAAGDLLPHGLVGRRARRGSGPRRRACTVSPTRSVPASGFSCADDHAEQRGLAGAVGADHADDAGGRQLERTGRRSAACRRSALRRLSASITTLPSRGPGGM